MMKLQTTYGDLRNGDIVYVQGYRMRAHNVRISSRKGDKASLHSEPNTDDVIRFNGKVVDAVDIKGTGYDNAVYGGYAFVPITVERPDSDGL